jgi:hypothetical protein
VIVSQEVFIQRSRLGRVIFWRRGDVLEITHEILGRKSKREIPIRSISSDYQIGSRRVWMLVIGPLVLATVCLAIYRTVSQVAIPVAHVFTVHLLMLGATALWASFKGLPRVEYFTFKDQWHRPLFSIVREPEQSENCNAFVADLLDHIDRLEQGLPEAAVAKNPGVSPIRSTLALPAEADQQNRWQLALAAGAVSAIFPLVTTELVRSVLGAPVVVVASACGLAAGLRSLMKKEPRKNLALVGIVLSLVPLVFFLNELALTAR